MSAITASTVWPLERVLFLMAGAFVLEKGCAR